MICFCRETDIYIFGKKNDNGYVDATPYHWVKVKNSFYSFTAVAGNKTVVLLIKDLQVAEKIIARPAGKLIFDHQKVVVDIAD